MASSIMVSQVSSTFNLQNFRSSLSTIALPKSSMKPLHKNKTTPPSNGVINIPQASNFINSLSLFNKSSVFLSPMKNFSDVVPYQPPKTSASSTETVVEEEKIEQNKLMISLINLLPEKLRPYAYLARLHRPIGAMLFAWPCMWSLALAAEPGSLPDWKMMAFFFFISFWSKNICCTINDYFDKDFDSQVERTKGRPLASGLITGTQALIFLGIQLVLGYAFLLPLNELSRLLWVSSLPLIFTYPLMKRITYWPQAHLGLTANWGVLYAWAAVKGTLQPAIVFPLLAGCFFWMLVIDTIYAHEDKADDVKAGVKSTALLLGDSTKFWNSIFGTASIACYLFSGFNANIGWPFYALMVPAAAQFAWQIWAVDLDSPADCDRKFRSNEYFGAILFGAILLGKIFS